MSGGPLRQPAVAGSFYPGARESLLAEVQRCIEAEQIPRKAIGVVAPHAGYVYSGRVAGSVYSRVEIPKTVFLLGPNHTGLGHEVSLMVRGVWSTPFGEVEIDEDLAASLLAAFPDAVENEDAHRREHSLETQLPFLQYFRHDFRIVPICLMRLGLEQCRALARALVEAIRTTGRDVLLVASSDMTHYEPHQSASEKDHKAIEAILNLDPVALETVVREYKISMCGLNPVMAMLWAGRELGAEASNLVRYETSGPVTGDMENVVGYAGIIIH
ncbi:MAG: AmmeMemoRadiSam system protein B [Nitrospinaceae bacterium]